MKRSEWFRAMQNLMWLTQLGLSLAVPPILCLLAAGWLSRRFGLGGWVFAAAIVCGIGASVCTFVKFAQMLTRRSQESSDRSAYENTRSDKT